MGKEDRNIILETQRLRLEEITAKHFQGLYRLLSNEVVQKYFPKALNKAETEDFLKKVQKRQKETGLSFWAVIHKKNNSFLGICGLLNQTIEGKEEIEVAYRINNLYWGNGFGTEAASGCQKYAKDILGLESIISLILPENKPSIRVAEKNGLILEKETVFHNRIHHLYRKGLLQSK
jgi:RimJ/RimL family protein N-acetyltransferase